jgi:hypothetical protein
MAPPTGWYYMQTPEGNSVVHPGKLGDKHFIAAFNPKDAYQVVS